MSFAGVRTSGPTFNCVTVSLPLCTREFSVSCFLHVSRQVWYRLFSYQAESGTGCQHYITLVTMSFNNTSQCESIGHHSFG
eukprot:scaffold386202_cov52-Prasinocladus_malaysianus.AAC.2